MPRKIENDQILTTTINRQDEIRKELDAKIDAKISWQVFSFIVIVLLGIISSIFWYALREIESLTNYTQKLDHAMTVLQMKVNQMQQKN